MLKGKLKVGFCYIANVITERNNPNQFLAQGYYLNEANNSTWEEFGPTPIGSLWNKFSQGPKSDFTAKSLVGQVLNILHLENWTDEQSKPRYAVTWQSYNFDQTPLEEELCLIGDELIVENTADYEALDNDLDEEPSFDEDESFFDETAEKGGFNNGK